MKLLSNITTYLFPKSTLLLISTNTSPKTLRLMRHRSNLGIDRSSFPSQTSKTSKSLQSHDFSSRRPQYFKSSISPWWKNQEKLERKEARLKLAMAIYRSSKRKFQNKTFFRCASISWFQVVSQSVIDVFRLAHLRVFQSYFGRGASLTNTKKQKKGKGKWCKWCVNNTCVWSKANSWFGLCVFIKNETCSNCCYFVFLRRKNRLYLFLSVVDEK